MQSEAPGSVATDAPLPYQTQSEAQPYEEAAAAGNAIMSNLVDEVSGVAEQKRRLQAALAKMQALRDSGTITQGDALDFNPAVKSSLGGLAEVTGIAPSERVMTRFNRLQSPVLRPDSAFDWGGEAAGLIADTAQTGLAATDMAAFAPLAVKGLRALGEAGQVDVWHGSPHKFKNPFKESVVQDVAYHGTPNAGFDIDKFGKNTSADIDGIYFAKEAETTDAFSLGKFKDKGSGAAASEFIGERAAATYPVYLDIRNPIDFTKKINEADFSKFIEKVKNLDNLSEELVTKAINKNEQIEKIYDIARDYYKSERVNVDPLEIAAKQHGIKTAGEYKSKKISGEIKPESEEFHVNVGQIIEHESERLANKYATQLLKDSGYDAVFRPDAFRAMNKDGTFNPFKKERVHGDRDAWIVFDNSQIKSKFDNTVSRESGGVVKDL